MVISISITRKKLNNQIIESFLITPNHSFLIDPKRAPYKVIWKTITNNSIANKYKLIDIKWENYSVIMIMEFSNREIDFKMNEEFKLTYSPVLGKKTCNKCNALKIFNNQSYCRTKSKKINKNSWYKCQQWSENINTLQI